MDKYFEALQKSKGSIALSIADQVGYDGTADVLEKGKAAAMGEIREWNGIKYQKTPKGWMLVKQQEGASKTEPEKKDKDSKSSPFVNKTMQLIKERKKNWGGWDEQREKGAERILIKNETLAKKFMSMTFPAAGWSSLFPGEKSIEISDNESIIFSAYKTTDTTSRNPAFSGSTDCYYRIYHKVGNTKKEISRASYSSASRWSTASESKNGCKIDGLIAFLHI